MAIDPEDRAERQAVALADLVDFLAEHGLDDRIAFTEVHNEVQVGHLADGLPERRPGRARSCCSGPVSSVRSPRSTPGTRTDRSPSTTPASPSARCGAIPENIDVLVTHPYVYGVLGAFIAEYGLRWRPGRLRPGARAARRPAARRTPAGGAGRPDAEWRLARDDRLAGRRSTSHDWGDAEAIDRWLYRHYGAWEQEMASTLRTWLDVARDWADGARRPARLRRGLDRLHPARRTLRGGPGRRRVLPAGHPRVPPRRCPWAPSSARTPHRSTPCGPTSRCSSSATRPSSDAPRLDAPHRTVQPHTPFEGEHDHEPHPVPDQPVSRRKLLLGGAAAWPARWPSAAASAAARRPSAPQQRCRRRHLAAADPAVRPLRRAAQGGDGVAGQGLHQDEADPEHRRHRAVPRAAVDLPHLGEPAGRHHLARRLGGPRLRQQGPAARRLGHVDRRRRLRQVLPGAEGAVERRRRQADLRARPATTGGASSTASPRSRSGASRSPRPGTSSWP